METGCGGELEVAIEPLVAPGCVDFADALARGLEQRRQERLVTLLALDGQYGRALGLRGSGNPVEPAPIGCLQFRGAVDP